MALVQRILYWFPFHCLARQAVRSFKQQRLPTSPEVRADHRPACLSQQERRVRGQDRGRAQGPAAVALARPQLLGRELARAPELHQQPVRSRRAIAQVPQHRRPVHRHGEPRVGRRAQRAAREPRHGALYKSDQTSILPGTRSTPLARTAWRSITPWVGCSAADCLTVRSGASTSRRHYYKSSWDSP